MERSGFEMKRNRIILLIAVYLFVLLVPIMPKAQAAEAERYGYTLLTTDAQRKAYQAIAAGVSRLDAQITFTIDGITQENVNAIADGVSYAAEMVCRDYPEYFWYHGGSNVSIHNSNVTVTPYGGYTVAGETVSAGSAKLVAAQNAMNTAISQAMAKIPANASAYDIALALHDHLAGVVSYEQVGDHQTAYGALVAHKAVCAGYAKAYQLLLNKAGIPCWYVTGISYDPNGVQVAHAWNLVWLNGKCYYTDVTWDDQGSELFHEYFNMSKAGISQTHFTNDILPASCGHDDYTYFLQTRDDGVCDMRTQLSVQEVASHFRLAKREGDTAYYACTIHYHGNDFPTWLNGNQLALASAIGFRQSYQYTFIELGMEYHVTFSGVLPETGDDPGGETRPTTPSQETEPSQSESTEPSQSESTQPSQSESTQPSVTPTTGTTQEPSEPTQVQQPTQTDTQPGATTAPTQPGTAPSEPVQQGTEPTLPQNDPTIAPTVQPTPSTPAPTEQVAATQPPAPDAAPPENNLTAVIVIAIGAVLAVGGALGYFLRKKK